MPSDTAAPFSTAQDEHLDADLTIVGAGVAGLYAALCAARAGARTTLISATPLAQTASYWAQGGLAAALAEQDSLQLHLKDTERAGRGSVRRSAAEILAADAPDCVYDLQSLGVRFDADRYGHLVLGLEGGHSVRRVVHAGGSATGRRVVRQLSALAVEEPLISILEGERARVVCLQQAEGQCCGVLCQNGLVVRSRAVILSTGGAAALWARTTNPPGSRGNGLLLAHALGADLADLEFVQFHPTAVIGVPGREGFLITEAIRGEGATLRDRSGERFVDELAPRDEVSRAIQARLAQTGESSVGLDMRAIDPGLFPNVVASLREAGLDPLHQLIPVAPAAHYTMGGILTDLSGRSTVPGLYAIGECSCTGLHGANRLASNSLSECLVFARRAAADALCQPTRSDSPPSSTTTQQSISHLPRAEQSTREALWRHAGIERSQAGLQQLVKDPHPLARMVGLCALERVESRGSHTRTDYPDRDPSLEHRHVVLARSGEVSWQSWS
jgi:L-aspartate oxidase